MTLGTVFKTVLATGPSNHDYLAPSQNPNYLLEKNGGAGDYYDHRYFKKFKGKSKSEKKQAILSALTLLAFLFFLNILQSCIREQNQNRGTVMMFPTAPTAPTGSSAQLNKKPDTSRQLDNKTRTKRSEKETPTERKSRKLLSISPRVLTKAEEENKELGRRQFQLVRNYNKVKNWTNQLSQVSEQDLKDQRLKTSIFPFHWKNFGSEEAARLAQIVIKDANVTEKGIGENVGGNLTVTGTMPLIDNENRTLNSSLLQSIIKNQNFQLQSGWRGIEKNQTENNLSSNGSSLHKNVAAAQRFQAITTPRIRRSDHLHASEQDLEEFKDEMQEGISLPPSSTSFNSSPYQASPILHYHNHKANVYEEKQPAASVLERPEIYKIVRETSEPLLLQTTMATTSLKFAHRPHEKIRYRIRYPFKNTHYRVKLRPTKYRLSPHRKSGFHEDYIRPVVLAKYPKDEGSGIDLTEFFKTLVETFAKPLTKLIPNFSKGSTEEPQCYDLLVCEAQRVSRLISPTAEALTATLGTLLTWGASEDTRRTLTEAINSGRVNTCQQQIKDCEDRSGGKSTLTVIAQVMEMKTR